MGIHFLSSLRAILIGFSLAGLLVTLAVPIAPVLAAEESAPLSSGLPEGLVNADGTLNLASVMQSADLLRALPQAKLGDFS